MIPPPRLRLVTPRLRFEAAALLVMLLTLSAVCARGRSLAPKPGGESAFDGWGTSLCWFANAVGCWPEPQRSEIADALFAEKGLGLTVVRYNIGGGEQPGHRHMPWFRQMDGFQDAAGAWHWDADAGQRWMLAAARERGARRCEAFSNSPPYWLTRSGCAAGAVNGNDDNLAPGKEEAFSAYLAAVVRHFREEWGIRFDTLEPMNEPWTDYWRVGHNQEGCHFDPASQRRLIQTLRRVLDRDGLRDVGISASDETNFSKAIESWQSYDEATRACVAQVNTHAYDTARRAELRALIASSGKPLVMSEVDGDADHVREPGSMKPALALAKSILDDLRDLRPLRWVFWQAVENQGADEAAQNNWGLIHADLEGDSHRWKLTKKYHAMAQFTRFIRPGSTILAADGTDAVSALDVSRTRLIVVLSNPQASEERAEIDLSAWPPAEREVAVYRTSATEDVSRGSGLRVESGWIRAVLPAESVTTLVVALRDAAAR